MAMTEANRDILLQVDNLHLSFGGVKVLNEINLAVHKGIIFSIIGPNGAGKTTLFNVITGTFPPTEGAIRFKDNLIENLKAHEIAKLGISHFSSRQIGCKDPVTRTSPHPHTFKLTVTAGKDKCFSFKYEILTIN